MSRCLQREIPGFLSRFLYHQTLEEVVALILSKWKKSHSQPPVGWCWLKPCRIMGNNGISTTFTSTDEFTRFLNHQLTWQWKMDSDWRCISYWKWGYIYIYSIAMSVYPEGNFFQSFQTILTSPHFFSAKLKQLAKNPYQTNSKERWDPITQAPANLDSGEDIYRNVDNQKIISTKFELNVSYHMEPRMIFGN